MFFLYSLVYTIGIIVSAPYYLWRYRKSSLMRESWRERFGYLPSQLKQERYGAIWVHAVSVGETLAVAGLIRTLQERYPDRKIFISHVTPTGRETGARHLPGVAGRFYLPLDWSACVHRVLNCLKPNLLLIVETELWPNLLRAVHQSGAKVVLVNARLSDRSLRGYRLFRRLMRYVLENVDCFFVQTARDAERFSAIGAAPGRVVIAGNLKFDGLPPEAGRLPKLLERALPVAGRGPVWVAASTMPGEEELVLKAWQEIYRAYPRSLLILAPRHPQRFERVMQLLGSQDIGFLRRTALNDNRDQAALLASPSVLLLDTLGELAGIFEIADVAFMGGSLVPTGGHNLLEPAQWDKPVIFGPHMENFRDAADIFLESKAAIRVQTWNELAAEVIRLFEDSHRRIQMGTAAREAIEKGRGATKRILDGISELLDQTNPRRKGAV
jgi:3-deoxy-D-manno-octulosonic-acid transferase